MPDLSREEREALRAWAADHNAARPTAATLSAVAAALDALDAAEQRAEKAEADAERLAEALREIERNAPEPWFLIAREALAQHERERA